MKNTVRVKYSFGGLGICLGILMVSKAYQCLCEGVKAFEDNRRQEKESERINQTKELIKEMNELAKSVQGYNPDKRTDA